MIIAQNIAAGKLKRVNGTLIRVGVISLSVSALLIVLFLIFPVGIFGVFTTDGNKKGKNRKSKSSENAKNFYIGIKNIADMIDKH